VIIKAEESPTLVLYAADESRAWWWKCSTPVRKAVSAVFCIEDHKESEHTENWIT
jgi:hypothetical protein